MEKGGFIIKGTLSYTTGFNILTKTPENQNNMLLLQQLLELGESDGPLYVTEEFQDYSCG